MVTANIIAAPRRKRNSTMASPQVPKPSEKAKFLEGHHFGNSARVRSKTFIFYCSDSEARFDRF